MRKRLVYLVGIVVGLLPGCSVHRENPNEPITLEVAVFEGGYGIEWHKQIAREYEKQHPNIRVNLWGDPRVDEKLKPRILRRNPPDLANCRLPVWKLIVANKLYPLDEALETPAYGQSITWRESLMPGVLADYQYQGKSYAMPSNLTAWVCWYDRRQFRRYGWQVPRTWQAFIRLCEQIKQDGVAPLAFQGKYPTYAWFTLISLYQRLVPFEQWYEMEDLKPGAFTRPEFIQAARLLQQLGTRYFQPGFAAMTHTESQLEWCNGRAALIFCGLWLKNEMKNALPPGFEMACFPVPVIEGGKGDPNAVYGGGAENFFVFAEAKHPREALDFLKFMVSQPNASSYMQQLSTLSPIRGAVRGIAVSSDLESAVAVLERSSRIFSDRLTGLYPTFGQVTLTDALSNLLSGRITPEAFAQRLEEGAETIRRNPDIYKPPARGVPNL